MVLPLGLIAIVGLGFLGIVRNSGIYTEALEKVRSHPLVLERLGEPIETGWQFLGSIELNNSEGRADFSIPVSGPLGSGRLFVEAEKEAGVWEYHRLEIRLEDSDETLLLLFLEAPPLPEAGSFLEGDSV